VPWYRLIDPPEDHEDEATSYLEALERAATPRPETLLELGAGAGHNALYLKKRFRCTLTDISEGMQALSRETNPECEHVLGDMRTLRLGREFDTLFVHDAVMYMTNEADLEAVAKTAFVHTRPGGAALFAPDHVRENFRVSTSHGGEDGEHRSLRYLEWTWDPNPTDTTYVCEYAYLLRESDGSSRVEHDRHIEGLFARADWLRLLYEAGFEPSVLPSEHSELGYECEVFVGKKAIAVRGAGAS